MNIVDNILSSLKMKKFNILCKNEDEWIMMQEYLFNNGYQWEVHGKHLTEPFWNFPIILKNYRSDDNFGSSFLIMDDFRYFSKNPKNKYVTPIGFIRKQKLREMKLL